MTPKPFARVRLADLSLEELAERRDELAGALELTYAELLNRALLEAGADDANVTRVAERAGVARATIYNELARRQEHRDTLEGNGAPPPAPADADEDARPARRRRAAA